MKLINENTETGLEVGINFGDLGSLTVKLTVPELSPGFQYIDVKSSNIERVGYLHNGELLRVVFHSGEEYEYEGVNFYTFKDLVQADSVGKYFNRNIRDKYPTVHLQSV